MEVSECKKDEELGRTRYVLWEPNEVYRKFLL